MRPRSVTQPGQRRRARHARGHLLVLALPLLLLLVSAAGDVDPREARVGDDAAAADTAREIAGEVCPALRFDFYLAAAMGTWSEPRALDRCPATALESSILDDVRLARTTRESEGTFVSELWRRACGLHEERVFYHHAEDFVALETEVRRVVRGPYVVGMSPPLYMEVLRSIATLLRVNVTRDLLPAEGHGPLPIIVDGLGGRAGAETEAQDARDVRIKQYRRHANRTLAASPQLIVSKATLARAMAYHEKVVLPSTIVRAYDLRSSPAHTFERDVAGLLRIVQRVWDDAVRAMEAEAAAAAAAAAALPLLPHIHVSDVVGPWKRDSHLLSLSGGHVTAISAYTRLRPLRRVLPTAIVYRTSPDCVGCEPHDRAFELLPSLFKELCKKSHKPIVSCSPLTLFLSTTHQRSLSPLPSLDVYARLSYTRAAVLHTMNTRSMMSAWGIGAEHNDAAADDAAAEGPLYSLESKYGVDATGIERELAPRHRFAPFTVPLRPIADQASVAQALTSMIASLAHYGVVQLQLLTPMEQAHVELRNEHVKERVQQQWRAAVEAKRDGQGGGGGGGGSGGADGSGPPDPESDPEYWKLRTVDELFAGFVATHVRLHVGSADLLHTTQSMTASATSSSSAPASSISLIFAAVRDCVEEELKRPLIVVLFLLVCAVQLCWNRAQLVAYW
ncbi:hypothetical protein NESM_000628500 [Novymonas esmeraldas]|uniref:Uncharacterized protein n=1 Tax=Novymonas esmeraldas TaxID=1808958 RepID=A0AAW0ERQ3_9TRYP